MSVAEDDAWLGKMIVKEQYRRQKEERKINEEKIRAKFPAVQDAYDKYQMLINLHKDHG